MGVPPKTKTRGGASGAPAQATPPYAATTPAPQRAPVTERQVKLLNRLLDGAGEEFEHGINARKYIALTGASKPTATRDLADLLEKGCLTKLPGGGRSTRYAVALDEM